MIRRLLGQLRAVWDLARNLVEVRGEIQELGDELMKLHELVNRLDERTRKQVYREKKDSEDASWHGAQGTEPVVTTRLEILRRARARGLTP